MAESKELSKSQSETDQKKPAQTKNIKFYVGQLGSDAREVVVEEGTTLKDVIKQQGWDGLEIRLNGADAAGNTPLKEQDVVVAVPDAITGGR